MGRLDRRLWLKFHVNGKQSISHTGFGRVGIGTASPLSTLHVNGPIATRVDFVGSNTMLSAINSVVLAYPPHPVTRITVTLPTEAAEGREITIKNVGEATTDTVTVASLIGYPIKRRRLSGFFELHLVGYYSMVRLINDGSGAWFVLDEQ